MYPSLYFIFSILITKINTMTTSKISRIVVVGGGAAGYFSAIECANTLSSLKNQLFNQYEVSMFVDIIYVMLLYFLISR